ncbi:MAG TPA: hypothetical protein EYP85_12055 [Armatimonadetes bacterium]|nr:hypothetical protein [Armatimonadota bacterium]
MRYFLGLDGGGTKTEAVIIDEEGRIVGLGTGGPAIFLYVDWEVVAQSLCRALRVALASCPAGQTGLTAGAVVIPIAPAAQVKTIIQNLVPVKRFLFPTEPEACVAAIGQPGPLLLIVSGTGSFAFAQNAAGETAHAGGKGPLLGDDGSAYDIGLRALRAVVQAEDGRGPSTRLSALLGEHLRFRTVAELVQRVYVEQLRRHQIAELAPLVDAAAEEGDMVARQILTVAGQELARAALTVARKVDIVNEPAVVAFFGSALRYSRYLRETVWNILQQRLPAAKQVDTPLQTAQGAALLAWETWGGAVPSTVRTQVQMTLSPSPLRPKKGTERTNQHI